MSAKSSDMLVDHVSNLSSSKKSVLFVSMLLIRINSPSEVLTRDGPLQRRRNLRINHLKNSGMYTLQ